MSLREVTARGNRDVGKVGSWENDPGENGTRGKYHIRKVAQGNRPGKSVSGEVSLDPLEIFCR